MTDNEDRAPPRGGSFSAEGADEPRETGARSGKEDASGRPRGSGARTRIAPTDPEVPSAKRRGAIRHQRSLVGLTAVIMGLLSITLALLYRAGRQVGTRDDAVPVAPRLPHPPGQTSASSHVRVDGNAGSSSSSPSATQSNGLREQPIFDDSASDGAAAGSGSAAPKNPPPALDIIRTPPF